VQDGVPNVAQYIDSKVANTARDKTKALLLAIREEYDVSVAQTFNIADVKRRKPRRPKKKVDRRSRE
jgi:hypothetical protein